MSDSRAVAETGETGIGRLIPLAICLPLVFLIGAPTIFITRALFWEHYPSHFVNDSPTISETASRAPASLFFEWGMLTVTLCIFVTWSLALLRNTRRIDEQPASPMGLKVLSWAACVTGILAGFFLATLSVYNLVDGHDVHMYGSWAFYISQVLAITLDILFVLWMRRIAGDKSGTSGVRGRMMVAAGVFVGSFFFLYMYLSKGSAAPADKYTIQIIYITAEYVVCMLCLFYPMTAYAELKRHLHEFAAADRRG